MERISEGSVVSPLGFRVGSARCGLKTASDQPDIALLVSAEPASAAGVFTTNAFAAAPVRWSQGLLPRSDLRAIAINSGNANACTGQEGYRTVEGTAALVAELLGCRPEQVAVASTGIIGRLLPLDQLEPGVRAAYEGLRADVDAARQAERAIMTTDTRPKASAYQAGANGKPVRVGGMAKGSGMIAPGLATMLVFLTTDAAVEPAFLQRMLREAAECTFNRITVDGDTSTNDSVFLLASGASGVAVAQETSEAELLRRMLQELMKDLSLQIVRDGEGATKLIEVTVTGARDDEDALLAARAIAHSMLVKCAIHGGDPNWGRIVCAAGYCGAAFSPDEVRLDMGGKTVFQKGLPTGEDASAEIAGPEAKLHLDLGGGPGQTTVWTCDLSKEYVEINAEYHT